MKIAIFTPFSNIWNISSLEASIGEHLRQAGHDVTLIFCGRLFASHCVAMSEAGLKQDTSSIEKRSNICAGCERRSNFFASETKLKYSYLESNLSQAQLDEIDLEISTVSIENWRNFKKLGVPLGRYAAYEFILENKLSRPQLTRENFDFYLNQLKNTIRSFHGWLNYLRDNYVDSIIVLNDLYSVNRAAVSAAKIMNKRTYNLSTGSDLRLYNNSITFSDSGESDLLASRHPSHESFSLAHMSKELISQVGRHFLELSAGKNAFSYTSKSGKTRPHDIRQLLGAPSDHSIVLVLTSSSDERVAADLVGIRAKSIQSNESSLFPDTSTWLMWISDNAHKFPKTTFVIRVHPRLFPNKREGVLAEAAESLKSVLSKLPENVVVNWPSQNVSLYDIASITRCVLNHTSSAGVEMLALGIPVIQHDPEGLYA